MELVCMRRASPSPSHASGPATTRRRSLLPTDPTPARACPYPESLLMTHAHPGGVPSPQGAEPGRLGVHHGQSVLLCAKHLFTRHGMRNVLARHQLALEHRGLPRSLGGRSVGLWSPADAGCIAIGPLKYRTLWGFRGASSVHIPTEGSAREIWCWSTSSFSIASA